MILSYGTDIAVAGVITTAVGAAVFDEPDLDPVPAASPPLPPSVAALMNPPAAVTRQLRRRLSAYGVDAGSEEEWISLTAFMQAAGQHRKTNQCRRFTTNRKGVSWTKFDGCEPRVHGEYNTKKGVFAKAKATAFYMGSSGRCKLRIGNTIARLSPCLRL